MIQEETLNEFDLLFEDNSFKSRMKKRSKEFLEIAKLYDGVILPMPKNGQIVNAKFIGGDSEYYVFSVDGYKDDIRVDVKPSESRYLEETSKGEMVEVVVTHINHDNFFIKGSISDLHKSIAHSDLKSLNDGESVKAYIDSVNPAGYNVELLHGGVSLSAFMPNTLAGINKLYDVNSIIGKTFDVMIESYAKKEGTYIVSRRKYLHSLIPSTIKELSYDDTYTGHVTGTTPFGVFVEFNECLTGMIHKANITPEWQNKISEIKPGFEIEFYVKEIINNPKNPKIILTQILRDTLWDSISNGQIIEGKVKATKQFGTLINLDEETVGLIHMSEMNKLNKKFTPGDNIKVRVLSVDRNSRKIFLTLN